MKPLPQEDLQQVADLTRGLWPEKASFAFVGQNGFIGSWMHDSLHFVANKSLLDCLSFSVRLPSLLPACDYAIVCPRWDVEIDWNLFKHVRKAVLFVSSGAAVHRSDAIGDKKRQDEANLRVAAVKYRFKAKIARLYATIGPMMPENYGFAAAEFLKNEREKKPIKIYNPDAQRTYLYAADMAVWLWKILFQGIANRPYIVGSEEVVTIGQLAEKIWPKGPKLFVPSEAKPDRYVPRTIFTRYGLGVRVTVNLDEAIRRTKVWQALP